MDLDNIRFYWASKDHMAPVDLITSDGSINCQANPNEQESTVAPLHFCEAVFALGALAAGGSLVIKMFTLYEIQSQALLYILGCAFEELSVVKPACSKSGNAETYIVGKKYTPLSSDYLECLLSFVGPDFPKDPETQKERALLSVDSMSAGFQAEMVECAKLFTRFFTDIIQRNLQLDVSKSRQDDQVWICVCIVRWSIFYGFLCAFCTTFTASCFIFCLAFLPQPHAHPYPFSWTTVPCLNSDDQRLSS